MATNQYAPLRQQLLDAGKLEPLGDGRVRFAEDVAFKSPSAAAAVLNNRNSAGPREWRIEATGRARPQDRTKHLRRPHHPHPSHSLRRRPRTNLDHHIPPQRRHKVHQSLH